MSSSRLDLGGAQRGTHQGAREEQEPALSDDQTPAQMANAPQRSARHTFSTTINISHSQMLTKNFSRRPPLPPLRRSHLRGDPDSAGFLLSATTTPIAFQPRS
jgi:hypothetical protein